jgi:hypothetical protein
MRFIFSCHLQNNLNLTQDSCYGTQFAWTASMADVMKMRLPTVFFYHLNVS